MSPATAGWASGNCIAAARTGTPCRSQASRRPAGTLDDRGRAPASSRTRRRASGPRARRCSSRRRPSPRRPARRTPAAGRRAPPGRAACSGRPAGSRRCRSRGRSAPASATGSSRRRSRGRRPPRAAGGAPGTRRRSRPASGRRGRGCRRCRSGRARAARGSRRSSAARRPRCSRTRRGGPRCPCRRRRRWPSRAWWSRSSSPVRPRVGTTRRPTFVESTNSSRGRPARRGAHPALGGAVAVQRRDVERPDRRATRRAGRGRSRRRRRPAGRARRSMPRRGPRRVVRSAVRPMATRSNGSYGIDLLRLTLVGSLAYRSISRPRVSILNGSEGFAADLGPCGVGNASGRPGRGPLAARR